MSIYGGFATRHQESFYNRLIDKLVDLLARKMIEIFLKYVPSQCKENTLINRRWRGHRVC
jgi:hypothetical protein